MRKGSSCLPYCLMRDWILFGVDEDQSLKAADDARKEHQHVSMLTEGYNVASSTVFTCGCGVICCKPARSGKYLSSLAGTANAVSRARRPPQSILNIIAHSILKGSVAYIARPPWQSQER